MRPGVGQTIGSPVGVTARADVGSERCDGIGGGGPRPTAPGVGKRVASTPPWQVRNVAVLVRCAPRQDDTLMTTGAKRRQAMGQGARSGAPVSCPSKRVSTPSPPPSSTAGGGRASTRHEASAGPELTLRSREHCRSTSVPACQSIPANCCNMGVQSPVLRIAREKQTNHNVALSCTIRPNIQPVRAAMWGTPGQGARFSTDSATRRPAAMGQAPTVCTTWPRARERIGHKSMFYRGGSGLPHWDTPSMCFAPRRRRPVTSADSEDGFLAHKISFPHTCSCIYC